MSLNIIDLIKGQLGPALVTQAATQLGESESGIAKAISGLLPAVVGGFANNANNPGLLEAITGANNSGLLGNLLGGSSNNSLITSLLSLIFGDKIGGLTSSIAKFAGISDSSSNSLLNLVTGATLGSVGKYATDNNLDSGGITKLLSDQKGIVSSLLPAGLSLASLNLGDWFGGAKEAATSHVHEVREETSYTRDRSSDRPAEVRYDNNNNNEGGGSILKWLLPILLLGLLSYFLWKQCKKEETNTTATSDTLVVDNDTLAENTEDTATIVTRENTTVTIPGGVTLNAYKGGIEDQIVAFLQSDEYKNANEDALKNRWFNFDNLNFEFGTTKLTAESQGQLENLKKILAAFPDAKVKIGAYTDKKGDDDANKKLSQDRANAVKAALNSAQVLEAEGYGEEFATVDENASDEAREADRKTAIRFTK